MQSVNNAQDTLQSDLNADYFVEAEVSNVTPFVGEEVTYIFRYYAFNLTAGIYDDLPDFEGFWLSEVSQLVTPRVETINNRQYSVMEVFAVLSPLRAGQLIIEPGVLDVPETLFDDATMLQTNQVVVNVQPLPEDAPDNFFGAVGQYDMAVTISETTTMIGQPISLSVTINGAGSLERLTAPQLPVIEGWRAYRSETGYRSSDIGGLRLGEKTFEWLLIPDNAGTQVLPPIIFSYFSPQSQSFVTLTGESFSIEVFPTASGERRSPRQFEVEDNSLAIFPVIGVLRTESNSQGILFWLLWGIAPFASFGIGGMLFLRDYVSRRNRTQRQALAISRFSQRLTSSIDLPADDFSTHAEQILLDFVSDKSGKSLQTLLEAESILKENITRDGVDLFLRHFTEAQSLRYVPQDYQSSRKLYVNDVVDTMRKIDRSWRVS
ncbi:MAG: BatD family protein [Aggregatilineales bacterium]